MKRTNCEGAWIRAWLLNPLPCGSMIRKILPIKSGEVGSAGSRLEWTRVRHLTKGDCSVNWSGNVPRKRSLHMRCIVRRRLSGTQGATSKSIGGAGDRSVLRRPTNISLLQKSLALHIDGVRASSFAASIGNAASRAARSRVPWQAGRLPPLPPRFGCWYSTRCAGCSSALGASVCQVPPR